jgi:hypothetical protein
MRILGEHGFGNVVHEWLSTGLVDDERLDYLEDLCGQLVPKEARAGRPKTKPSCPGASGSGASQTPSTPNQAAIREVLEVVGDDYGDGFILQCLLHYGSVAAVVGGLLDGPLPPQLAALPRYLSMKDSSDTTRARASAAASSFAPSVEDKKRIMAQTERLNREAAMADAQDEERRAACEYDDDFDDSVEALALSKIRVGGGSDSEGSDESGSSGDDRPGPHSRHRPVQGQTYQARRKEANKGKVSNHNRRDQAWKKTAKLMS